MTHHADRFAPMLAALALAGCGGGGGTPTSNVASPVPGPVATTSTPVPVSSPAIVGSVPDAMTVSTNEPFYTVKIAGDVLTIIGVDAPLRRFQATGRTVTGDTHEWAAQDAKGKLLVQVVRAPCQDDMSGAPRDFTATLTIDSRTVRGCGYVGTPAPPPEEAVAAANTIPTRFVGRWNRDAAACARPAASIEGLRVTPNELWFHESVGAVRRVEALGPDQLRITADYDGEGERWTATQTLHVVGDRLTIVTDGQPFSRMRCPDQG